MPQPVVAFWSLAEIVQLEFHNMRFSIVRMRNFKICIETPPGFILFGVRPLNYTKPWLHLS